MQRIKQGIIFALIMGILLPSVMFRIAVRQRNRKSEVPAKTDAPETSAQTEPSVGNAFYIPVLLEDGTIENMELETYITGVVLAEMPADFEKEALKAQAVVARTYALKLFLGEGKHEDHAVCTDPSCCQAYCSAERYLGGGGTQIAVDKVSGAVEKTRRLVLIYDSQLIEATYFSCSGGRTEDAQAVWGRDVPYLQSTASPGEEEANYYIDTVYFTYQEFADCMQLDVSKLQGHWIGDIKYTRGGGVERIEICKQEYTGTEIRKMLGLRSTAFYMTAVGNTVTVTTKGYGHRVGMSQYGADAMAVNGSTFKEILSHYYQGTTVEEFVV